MEISIRPLASQSDYRAFADLEKTVWPGIQPITDDILLTVHKNGGLVLGAFADRDGHELMVGLLFGFPALTPDRRIKHHSHVVGVHPDYRDFQIGFRLKLAQREAVLAQGIDHITWTYDPLQSRNAHLNLRKLGAVCNTYLSNLYGEMTDGINAGLASDRFQVDWYIASRHVAERLEGRGPGADPGDLTTVGALLLNPGPAAAPDFPPLDVLALGSPRVLVRVPASLSALKARNLEAAQAWRRHTASIFQPAFEMGYVAVDVVTQGDASYYLLEKGWICDGR